MIGLKTSALIALVVGLGGCVIPIDDGRPANYYHSGYHNYQGPGWHAGPHRYERRQYENRRFEQYDRR